MDLIIRNSNVDGKIVDVGISNGRIVAIKNGKIDEISTDEIDANGRMAITGFVDSHLHLDKSLLNERAPYQDLTGPEKGALTREEKAKFTVKDIIDRAERILLNGISAGNIAIRTNVDVDPIVGLKGIEALLYLKEKYADVLKIQIVAFAQEGVQNYPETVGLLEEALKMGADLIGGHTIIDKDGEEHIDAILKIAKKYDVEVDFHLDESGKKEHYLLPYLANKIIDLGLQGKVNGIHCCTLANLNENELNDALQLINESRLKVTIAPTAISTRALAPVKDLLRKDVIVGIGSDNIRDFFNPLGNGDVKQAAYLLAYVHRFFTDEEITSIWDMITIEGARLLNLEGYGIEVGNVADITLIDAKSSKEALANQSPTYLLIRKGKVLSENLLNQL